MNNSMFQPRVSKVTVNIGVGEGGEKLAKAETLLEQLTGQKPIKTFARESNQTFGIRQSTPIACKVTLRKEIADKFLLKVLESLDNRIEKGNFDDVMFFDDSIKNIKAVEMLRDKYPKVKLVTRHIKYSPGYRGK